MNEFPDKWQNEKTNRVSSFRLADQNLKLCRRLCIRVYILEKGRIVYQGSLEGIRTDEGVVKRCIPI